MSPVPKPPLPSHPLTGLWLGTITVTLVVWVLRGVALLAFIPGAVLWLLLLASIGLGVVRSLQRVR